jgi:hypothetical protein
MGEVSSPGSSSCVIFHARHARVSDITARRFIQAGEQDHSTSAFFVAFVVAAGDPSGISISNYNDIFPSVSREVCNREMRSVRHCLLNWKRFGKFAMGNSARICHQHFVQCLV